MLFFMLAAFLPLVLACEVFLLGTAIVDTSLYIDLDYYLIFPMSHRYSIFTEARFVNELS